MDIHSEKQRALQMAMAQVSVDLNASAADFLSDKNIVTPYVQHMDRRKFGKDSQNAFKMACFGTGSVLSAPEVIVDELQTLVQGKDGKALFHFDVQCAIDKILRTVGLSYGMTTLAYLPAINEPVDIEMEGSMRFVWYEQADMPVLYQHKGLENAVGYDMQALRPDVIAVAAFEGDELLGAAGASEDAAALWQVGVDVLPDARGRGIATVLVDLLRAEIQQRGIVPYYCTGVANLFSRNVAINCGFFPAWVEGYANEMEQ